MTITKKVVAAVTTAAALSGATIAGTGAATAQTPAVEFTRDVQNVYYNYNLDYLNTPQVKVRPPGGDYQNWTFKLVGHTADGTGIYTIRWDDSCITNQGLDKDVKLTTCNDLNLAERWIVDTAQNHTTIVSQKNPDQVLQANDIEHDGRVSATAVQGTPTDKQLWTLYQP